MLCQLSLFIESFLYLILGIALIFNCYYLIVLYLSFSAIGIGGCWQEYSVYENYVIWRWRSWTQPWPDCTADSWNLWRRCDLSIYSQITYPGMGSEYLLHTIDIIECCRWLWSLVIIFVLLCLTKYIILFVDQEKFSTLLVYYAKAKGWFSNLLCAIYGESCRAARLPCCQVIDSLLYKSNPYGSEILNVNFVFLYEISAQNISVCYCLM